MTSEDIYAILSSKPHNPYYLKKYFKFILSCTNDGDEYVESHHICPKAKDMFPEHKDDKWNFVTLTARQHIMAHIMLWKVYGGSQSQALECMLGQFNADTNSRLSNRRIPDKHRIRYLAKAREDAAAYRSRHHIGKAAYRTTNGIEYLQNDDPRIDSENLKGILHGFKMTDESREKMRRSKDHSRVIWVYFMDCSVSVPTKDLQLYLDQGWTVEISVLDRDYIKTEGYKIVSQKMSGRARHSYPDGTYYGMIPHDDPKILELGLILQPATELQIETSRNSQRLAVLANTGSTIYNNGTREEKFHSHPGLPWVVGRLPRTEEHDRKQRAALSAAIAGGTTWTDGTRNYRLPPNGVPEAHWVRGMGPQKKRCYQPKIID